MIGELSALLEATSLARELRASTWLYPLVNAAHVLGIGLLLGAIVALDLRLLGAWRGEPLAPLWRVLSTVALSGIVIGVTSGALLFAARASEYVQSPYFLGKMAVVAVGGANALGLRWCARRGRWADWRARAPAGVRLSAAVSLVAWTSALVLGRLIGYF